MRPVVARVTTAAPLQYVNLDTYHGAALAVAVVIESGPLGQACYQIDYTFEDPNDLISPVPLGSINWDNSLIPSVAQSALVSTTFTIATAPIWARVQILPGATSVRMVFTMYEAHRTTLVARMPPSQMLTLAHDKDGVPGG